MKIPQPLIVDPKWFPALGDVEKLDRFHISSDGGQVGIKFSRHEKRVLKKRREIPVSQWAERHRFLPIDAAVPGRWKNSTVPYAAGILDASFFLSVQEVVIWKIGDVEDRGRSSVYKFL